MRRRGAVRGGPKGRAIAVAVALLGLLAASSAGAAPRVTVGIKPLLGGGGARASTLLVATVCSEDPLDDATLELDFGWRRGTQVHRERLSVPAGRCVRHVFSTTAADGPVATLRAKDGRAVARGELEAVRWWRSSVVLDPSLKGIVNGGGGAIRFMTMPRDLEIPPDAMDWSHVLCVVTRDRTLSDQPANTRRAVEHYVARGGVLVIASSEAAPNERRGAGTVLTLPADESLPRRLVELLDRGLPRTEDSGRLSLEPGTSRDLSALYWNRRDVRGLLEPIDPNLQHPPSSALSWALLLAYVAVIGPLSYRFLLRRGHPALAIGSVPASAACLMAALLGHGLLEKGVGPRSSSLAFAEGLAGDRTVAMRRVAGFVTTRPGTLRIVSSRGGFLDLLTIGDRPAEWHTSPRGRGEGRRMVLETRSVGLWDTVFVSEGAFADLGGAIEIRPIEGGYRVLNRTPQTIRSAALHRFVRPDYEPRLWSLGTLAPGAVVEARGHGDLARTITSGPLLFQRSTHAAVALEGVSLLGELDAPLLPAFEGFARDGGEPTMLRVVLP